MTRALLIAASAAWLIASPALAATSVVLRAEVLDDDGMVTLGDLFEGAGAAGKGQVAAKPGASTVLDAGAVQGLARRNGLAWANASGIRRIVVRSGAPGATASAT